MPCLSSRPVSVLNESTRVSKAESQLALPLRITTCFGASMVSSPNGSAACVGGGGGAGPGASAVAGASAGDLVSAGGGAGAAGAVGGTGVVAGLVEGVEVEGAEVEGAGDCASAAATFSEISAAGTNM